MKSILMSIQPKWVAKILNGEKTIEIRKRFPKDYKGWVYIYCTKSEDNFYYDTLVKKYFTFKKCNEKYNNNLDSDSMCNREYNSLYCKKLNGKIVTRFWVDNVEKLFNVKYFGFNSEFKKNTQLSQNDIDKYLGEYKIFYAIHISNLEIFDKPKELKEFKIICQDHKCFNGCKYFNEVAVGLGDCMIKRRKPILKAPQSWRYIEEVEE